MSKLGIDERAIVDGLGDLRHLVDNLLDTADYNNIPGAINWGDLGCREAQYVFDDSYHVYLRVLIEELDPNNPALLEYLNRGLVEAGYTDVEIEFAW